MSMITVPRVGGLALIIGAVTYIVSTLLMPGFVIGAAGPNDLQATLDAIASRPLLTYFAAAIGAVGVMFLLWGYLVVWQTAQTPCALDIFIKYGLVGVMIAVVFLLLGHGFSYTASHVIERGIGAGTGPDQTEALNVTARQMLSAGAVARLVGAVAGLTGYIALGFGFARKFKPGGYRELARVVGIVATVSMIGLMLTVPFSDFMNPSGPVFTALSILYFLWWIVIGVGVYQQRFALQVGVVTPEH
ncbi:MAG: hypothetical protein F4X40_04160 [Chloroflexi bacterium]|nr:hypothetical protein [Chloroflexota bacterium]